MIDFFTNFSVREVNYRIRPRRIAFVDLNPISSDSGTLSSSSTSSASSFGPSNGSSKDENKEETPENLDQSIEIVLPGTSGSWRSTDLSHSQPKPEKNITNCPAPNLEIEPPDPYEYEVSLRRGTKEFLVFIDQLREDLTILFLPNEPYTCLDQFGNSEKMKQALYRFLAAAGIRRRSKIDSIIERVKPVEDVCA